MSLSNSQYESIVRDYNKQQLQNEHGQHKRQEEIYKQIPAVKAIDEEISSISVAQAKRLLEGDEEALLSLKKKVNQLTAERTSLITSNGYPVDYLRKKYRCPDCKDTGYINGKKCHCFRQAAIDLVYMQSNLKQTLEEENFDHFQLDLYAKDEQDSKTGLSAYETAEKALKESHDFVRHFNESSQSLLFYGGTGVGKTYLSNCIAKDLLDSGHSVIYFTAFDLFELFRNNTFQRDRESSSDYQNVFNCDLLIIDDLGTEMSNSFTTSQLFLCLNERILRRKSTVISTNLEIGEIADVYSERTFSRIFSHYELIHLCGTDIRIKKKFMGIS